MAIPLNLSEVPDVAPYIQYVAAGGQTSYPYPFPITQDSDLVVVVNGVTLGTDSGYTLTGQGNDTGGNMVLSAGSTSGDIITLYRDITIERITQFSQNSGFSSAAFNAEFNNLYLIAQQLESQIAQCLQVPNTNNPAPVTTLLPSAYANKYLSFDAYGNPQPAALTSSGSLTAAIIAGLTGPQTAYEASRGVVPTNLLYGVGDLRRYGATGGTWGSIPAVDDSGAWATAVKLGLVIVPPLMAFKVVTGATLNGSIVVLGAGATSQLYCDASLLSVTGGSNSFVDNIYIGNITAPWIVPRTVWNNGTVVSSGSLVQSNTVLGYQPTVNDPEYTTWVAAIPAVGTQNIGPIVQFSGAASGITISRIFGRFAQCIIQDATSSTIRDCDLRGGKGVWGTLQIDNSINNVQRGVNNRIINNRVQYGSFSACFIAANDDYTISGNHFFNNGESGVKIQGCAGASFTASVGAATTGTIAAPAEGFPNGSWTFNFEGGQTRAVTITGNTTATWTGALGAGPVNSASVYNTSLNPQCFRGLIEGNHCYSNFYDGLDTVSTYNTTVDAAPTYVQCNNNYSYANGGVGIGGDGRYNSYVGNHILDNYDYGFWGTCSFSLISSNHAIGNNAGNGAGVSDLLPGIQGNSIIGNRVVYTASSGFSIFAAQQSTQVPHVAADNVVVGAAANWGNPEAIYPVLSNNIDAITGARTRQSGMFYIQNSAGTLQHAFYNDITQSGGASATRIVGNTSGGFTNTPTGTDASTAFAAGAKVSTTDTNGVILNTAAQWNGDIDFEARIVQNTTTTALNVSVSFESFSVNGVAQYRPVLKFYNAATGAAFTLNTTNIGASTFIKVQFSGFLS